MASTISHAVAALAIGACFYDSRVPKRVWVIGAACSMAPDLDVIGFRFGVRYGDFWGHRGFAHSLVFAALLAAVAVLAAFRSKAPGLNRFWLWLYLFLTTASHGLLDAMTSGGLGIAFFSPFDNTRYFLPWRPLRVSPIAAGRFLSSRGVAILENEFLWIWVPGAMLATLAWFLRRQFAPAVAGGRPDAPTR